MEKNDMKDKLKNTLKGATDSVKSMAQNIKIPEIKAPDVKIPDQIKGVFKKKEGAQQKNDESVNDVETKQKADDDDCIDTEHANPVSKESEGCTVPIRVISTKNAMKVFYYLMAVDGEIFHNEEDKFDEIGAQLDPDFLIHREEIINECRLQLNKVIDAGDYYDVVQDGVEEAILIPDESKNGFITPKLLVWDLLTIAHSDEQYDEKERKLIKYIVRKLNVDATIFLEMENTIQTLSDIERETNWIKTTNRPYLTIEAQVNELADRRNTVFESAKDLIML